MWETPKQVLLQIVKTQMKCHILGNIINENCFKIIICNPLDMYIV